MAKKGKTEATKRARRLRPEALDPAAPAARFLASVQAAFGSRYVRPMLTCDEAGSIVMNWTKKAGHFIATFDSNGGWSWSWVDRKLAAADEGHEMSGASPGDLMLRRCATVMKRLSRRRQELEESLADPRIKALVAAGRIAPPTIGAPRQVGLPLRVGGGS